MPGIFSLDDLLAATERGEPLKYLFFWGHTPPADGSVSKSCFSQWFPSPFTVDGICYPTAEHFMMAAKARLFGDREIEERVLKSSHPKQAKELGRKVRGFDEATWTRERYRLVVEGNLGKFSRNPPMKDFLLTTGERVLVEASPYDKIWGIGMSADHRDVENPVAWNGLNLLGFALMEVRSRLRAC
ncbi:NADAR family protein [Luteolibacter flavescens]|uniref:NADAR family protein n=1 Tax=Luteolibacter flavescens TaxID=1859460 RepID=A0ABT3FST5_9BACT|nr:NADAR family protein [Luteolibacter flavescens]MCW1886648.1 NADAR family protein [Luteolibacter flavescens]